MHNSIFAFHRVGSYLRLQTQQTLIFDRYYERHPRHYPTTGTRVFGLCMGSLAAAAIVSSCSLTDLLPLALETVGIAFRIGLQALDAARQLDSTYSRTESWAYVFYGVDKQSVDDGLEEFSRDLVR